MWSEKEKPIISEFYSLMSEGFKKKKYIYRLLFSDETQILAKYVACGESDNDLEMDDPNYEEFFEFYLKVQEIEKKGSALNFSKDEGICLNYHNFPIKWELAEIENK